MKENQFGPPCPLLWIIRWWRTSSPSCVTRTPASGDFRELVSEIGMLITYEATRDLPMTTAKQSKRRSARWTRRRLPVKIAKLFPSCAQVSV